MCKGVVSSQQALEAACRLDDNDCDSFNWFDAIELEDDEEFGFQPPEPQSESSSQSVPTGASAETGMDLLDWFSKQLNSEMMVAPNGAVLPTAPLAEAPPVAAEAPMACDPQQFAAPAAVMATSTSFTSCYQEPAALLPGTPDFQAAQLQQLQLQQQQQQLLLEQEQQQELHPDHHQQRVVVIKRHDTGCHKRPSSTRPYQHLAELSEEDRIERVKQKRRESAQRSRARKNAYMKELEGENAALKQQVLQLKSMVSQLQAHMAAM